ncbi:MAG TPA: DNA methyltransferase, partial [Candidatus Cybelea sp.]|nr:DNA methyltransferase [Candidatus Cybelea sp.]
MKPVRQVPGAGYKLFPLAEAAGPLAPSALSQTTREDNKLRVEDRAAHDWYRFVLSYPAHIVRTYVERFGLDSKHNVLDPFCGTGTTIVECKKLGI